MTKDLGRLRALTTPRLLGRNIVASGIGLGFPAVAALVAFPLVAARLGPDRFAIVALAWGLAGWFAQLDFGIGRGLTRAVASRHAEHRDAEIPAVVWSAHAMLAAVAVGVAFACWFAAPLLVHRVLTVPAWLADEAIRCARWMSVAIVPVVLATASRAVLEARQQFALSTAIRVPALAATYLLPILATDAAGALAWIVVTRIAYAVALLLAVRVPLALPNQMRGVFVDGRWIALSAVISPLLVQGDRFAVAAALPIAVSGSYAAAQEIATKLAFFSIALQPVLFAAASAARNLDAARARRLAHSAFRTAVVVVLGPVIVCVLWADPLMQWWLKSAYDPVAASVLPWMAVAMFANALAQIPYALLQSGRSDRAVALLHLVELPLFLIALAIAVPRWGLTGAAAVWGGRLIIDALALWLMSLRGPAAASAAA